LWNTGAIGIAVAFNRFEIAIALSLLNIVTLYLVGQLQKSVDRLHENDHDNPDA
jgi:putative Mg2+ transporter-C (MgtC) family protein